MQRAVAIVVVRRSSSVVAGPTTTTRGGLRRQWRHGNNGAIITAARGAAFRGGGGAIEASCGWRGGIMARRNGTIRGDRRRRHFSTTTSADSNNSSGNNNAAETTLPPTPKRRPTADELRLLHQQQRQALIRRMIVKQTRKREQKRRRRPFVPLDIIAFEREVQAAAAVAKEAQTAAQHASSSSVFNEEDVQKELLLRQQSSSATPFADMSFEQLQERTKRIRKWCEFANDLGRKRAERASPAELQAVFDEIVRLMWEWRIRAGRTKNGTNGGGHVNSDNNNDYYLAAQHCHELYSVVQTTRPAMDHVYSLECLDTVLDACRRCGSLDAAILAEKAFVRSFHPPRIQSYNLLIQCWTGVSAPPAPPPSSSLHPSASVPPDPTERVERLWHDILEEVQQNQRCYPTNETIVQYMAAWTASGKPNGPEKVAYMFKRILGEQQKTIPPPLPPRPIWPPEKNSSTTTTNDGLDTKRREPPLLPAPPGPPAPPLQRPPPPPPLQSQMLQRILRPHQAPVAPPPSAPSLQWRRQPLHQLDDFVRHHNIWVQDVVQRYVRPPPRVSPPPPPRLGQNAIEQSRHRPAVAPRQVQPPPPPPRNLIFRDVRLDDDPAVFHGVIQAWGTSGRGRGAAMEAERIVHDVMPQHGCRPDAQTYALLVAAWTEVERLERTGDAAAWAEMLLHEFLMVQHRRQQPQQQMRSIGIVADAFTTCITSWTWAATHHPDAPARAEALYRQLLQLLQQETEVKLDHRDDAPSSASSHDDIGMEEKWVVAAENAVLSTWARCSSHLRPDAINHMQQHFSSMKHPNLTSYNIMLDGYARRGMRREARELFDTMKKHDRRDLRPDLASYNTLLKAMVHATDTQRKDFESVLFEMEDILSPIAPDKFTYTLIMEAWAKSSDPERLEHCKRLVDIMIFRSIRGNYKGKPDAFAHAILLDVCVNRGDNKAEYTRCLNVATETIERLQSKPYLVPPNAHEHAHYEAAYVLYLRAMVIYRGQATKLARTIIKCGQGGWLSSSVVRELQKAGDVRKDPLRLLKDYDPSWSRNVKERDRICPMLKYTKDVQGELRRAYRLKLQPINNSVGGSYQVLSDDGDFDSDDKDFDSDFERS